MIATRRYHQTSLQRCDHVGGCMLSLRVWRITSMAPGHCSNDSTFVVARPTHIVVCTASHSHRECRRNNIPKARITHTASRIDAFLTSPKPRDTETLDVRKHCLLRSSRRRTMPAGPALGMDLVFRGNYHYSCTNGIPSDDAMALSIGSKTRSPGVELGQSSTRRLLRFR